MNQYLSEKEALKALKITSFDQINSKNITEFAALFKRIDPEVARMALNKIPEFSKTATTVCEAYKHSFDRSINAIETLNSRYHEAYMKKLEIIEILCKDDDLCSMEREMIIEALLDLESRKTCRDEEDKMAIRYEREVYNKNTDDFWGGVLFGGLLTGVGVVIYKICSGDNE